MTGGAAAGRLPDRPLLDRRRVLVAGATVAAANLAIAAVILRAVHAPGSETVMDFAAFWTAARMALGGEAALAYDPEAHRAAMNAALGIDYRRWMSWFYPPQFQLALVPLAPLPLAAAQAAFTGATLALYLRAAWAVVPGPATLAAALVPAPVILNLVNGQTGFLVAALVMLTGLAALRGRAVAGVPLGLLALKPQVALALPVALLAGGQVRALLVAAGTVVALVAASVAAFGPEPWQAFIAAAGRAGENVGDIGDKWLVSASVYGWLRGQGMALAPAMAAQAAVALPVLAAVALAWARPAVPRTLAVALAAYASAAVTPRIMDYDLLILVAGALFQVRHMREAGAARWEAPLLAVAALLPLADFLTPLEVNAFLAPALAAGCLLRIRQVTRAA